MSTESVIHLTNMYTKELDKLRADLATVQTHRDQYATVAQARIEQIQRMEADLVAAQTTISTQAAEIERLSLSLEFANNEVIIRNEVNDSLRARITRLEGELKSSPFALTAA